MHKHFRITTTIVTMKYLLEHMIRVKCKLKEKKSVYIYIYIFLEHESNHKASKEDTTYAQLSISAAPESHAKTRIEISNDIKFCFALPLLVLPYIWDFPPSPLNSCLFNNL